MNRDDLKDLAQIRLREANVLLEKECYEGAYYLCGYVIECGLKACIAKQTRQYDFPDKNTVNASYIHNLVNLIKTAGIEPNLITELKKDKIFESNWAIVKDWTEESRYKKTDKQKAKDMYSAVTNTKHGVLRWIKHHW
jgi:hypothetical protein